MSRLKTIIGPSIAGVALLAAGVSGVLAARGPGHGAGGAGLGGGALVGYGTLSAISATGATIATPNNSNLTVTFTSQATYTAHSQGAATAGLKSGQQVAVYGTSVNGTVTAGRLDYDTTPFVAGTVRYTGTVSSSSASSLSLTTSSGQTITVQLTSTTRYGIGKASSTTAPTFSANQQVRVTAAQYTDGSLVAQVVTIPSTATANATSTSAPAATATATTTP
jgi:hypothetical protein